MDKKRMLQCLVGVLAIAIPTTSFMFSNNKKYDYELPAESILTIIEESRTTFLVTKYKANRSEKDINSDLVQDVINLELTHENMDIEEEASGKVIDEINKDIIALSKEENALKDQELVHRDIEQPNSGSPITENRAGEQDLSHHLNNYVLDLVKSYDYKGGNYPYLLNNDYENYNGVTEDIYYKGELLLKAHPSGIKYSHCTGITYEVFFKAMQNRNKANGIDINDFNGITMDGMMDFMLDWYVATGPKAENNLVIAMEKYGIGKRIRNLEAAAPGDFIDLSRENNTGHAVVFIDWIRDSSNKIIGLKHWSSQQSTKGIGYKEEYFNIKGSNGQKYGNVILDNLHIGRISPISEYR